MESCGMSCIKYLLFIFNLIFAISGIGIIAAGAIVLEGVGDVGHFMESRMYGPPIVLIVVGSIIFLIAFLGCFGALRESYFMLICFAACLLIIFIMELAVGIAAAVYKNDFEDALKDKLKASLGSAGKIKEEADAWDVIQQKSNCCGINGPDDWSQMNLRTPITCCNFTSPADSKQLPNTCPTVYYREGCFDKLKSIVLDKATILLGVGIGVAFVQIIGIVLACLLAQSIKREGGK